MNYIAIAVFVVAYVLIAGDRLNKAVVALAGAAIMVVLPVIESDDVFYSRNTGIDWDVIFLLLGMMIIVSVLRQTGVFEYVAIWAAKRASPRRGRLLSTPRRGSHTQSAARVIVSAASVPPRESAQPRR